jgi:hypothetical protein
VWHDLAQVSQTPGDGEQPVDTMLGGTVQDRAEQMAAFGIPLDIATAIAAAQGSQDDALKVGRLCSELCRPSVIERPVERSVHPTRIYAGGARFFGSPLSGLNSPDGAGKEPENPP